LELINELVKSKVYNSLFLKNVGQDLFFRSGKYTMAQSRMTRNVLTYCL